MATISTSQDFDSASRSAAEAFTIDTLTAATSHLQIGRPKRGGSVHRSRCGHQELEDGGHVGRLKRGLQDKYTAALKRARLYSAAAQDKAPPDKLAKIKDRFQREYLFEKTKAEEADHLAYTRLRQIGEELKVPFRPDSRVCRGRK